MSVLDKDDFPDYTFRIVCFDLLKEITVEKTEEKLLERCFVDDNLFFRLIIYIYAAFRDLPIVKQRKYRGQRI